MTWWLPVAFGALTSVLGWLGDYWWAKHSREVEQR